MSVITINAQSSIRVSGSKIIYFDPFQIKDGKNDADVIFVTHEHYDHFSPEDILKVAKPSTVFVVPASMKAALKDFRGLSEVVFVQPDTYGSSVYDAAGIKFSTVRSYNVGKPFHKKESDWVGYIVDFDGETVFVTGDTDANEDNLKVKCDLLLVPCGGKYTFDAKEAADFAAKINPKKAIPTHYGNVVGNPADGNRFAEELKKLASDIEVTVLL